MAFKEVDVSVWKPENAGDIVEGILVSVDHNVGTNDSELYILDAKGKPTSVWGSAILDAKMIATNINDLIRIEYLGLGEAKPGRHAPKLFKVSIDYEHREKNKIEDTDPDKIDSQ